MATGASAMPASGDSTASCIAAATRATPTRIDGARTSQANRPSPAMTRRAAKRRSTPRATTAAIAIANRLSTPTVCAGGGWETPSRAKHTRARFRLELEAVSLDDRERSLEVGLGPEARGEAREAFGVGRVGELGKPSEE